MVEERVDILDFGGQYTHLIAKRIRRQGVFSRICQPEEFDPGDPGAVGAILSGGPSSVNEPGAPALGFDLAELRMPVLGLCYGHQLLAVSAGGQVASGGAREYGMATIDADDEAALFGGLPGRQRVWMSHGDHVTRLPDGFRVTASTPTLPVAAFESADRRVFGLQFHPEVTHTEHGTGILDNFLTTCRANRTWNPESYEREAVSRVQEVAGDRKLFLLVSGGVDSLVTLAVCVRAVGPERVFPLHVDTGLMRLDESARVMEALTELGFANLRLANAKERYFRELAGKIEPEQKRAIIGRLFVEVVEDELASGRYGGSGLGEDWMLVQGTIYPDSIESGGTDKAALIKTHHNRVAEIERLIAEGKIIEPLIDLYKDEVRDLGEQLGLPRDLVERHPFPGPGLGIRVIGSDTEVPEPGFDAEQPLLDEVAASLGLHALILPIRSVGVQGDARTYAHPAAVWGSVDWELLHRFATRAVNALSSVNRVIWSPVDARTLRFGRNMIEPARVELLQVVDDIAHRLTADQHEIWQMPVVSLPLFDPDGGQAFVLRPVRSRDAMTADFFRMDPDLLAAIGAEVAEVEGAGPVLYDVTTKPPSTIEWE